MRLLSQYQELHAQGKFPGVSVLQHAGEIAELVAQYKAKRLLDFGCGMAFQYSRERVHLLWGVDVPTLYDPASRFFSNVPPGTYHGVVCTDVLEHVPEEELEETARMLAGYTKRFAFVSVCSRPANLKLPNGSNAHCTVKPFEWWQEYLEPFFVNRGKLYLRASP